MYDAIVVGAHCAGSPTAILVARSRTRYSFSSTDPWTLQIVGGLDSYLLAIVKLCLCRGGRFMILNDGDLFRRFRVLKKAYQTCQRTFARTRQSMLTPQNTVFLSC